MCPACGLSQCFAIFLSLSTLCFVTMLTVVLLAAGRPRPRPAIHLPVILLHVNPLLSHSSERDFPRAVDYLPYVPGYQSRHCCHFSLSRFSHHYLRPHYRGFCFCYLLRIHCDVALVVGRSLLLAVQYPPIQARSAPPCSPDYAKITRVWFTHLGIHKCQPSPFWRHPRCWYHRLQRQMRAPTFFYPIH